MNKKMQGIAPKNKIALLSSIKPSWLHEQKKHFESPVVGLAKRVRTLIECSRTY